MASKLQIITELLNSEVSKVAENYENWTSFLKCASNNFKYGFTDQILIYAQRPDATACAEIEVWNKRVNRWVNRGATGIALIDYSGNGQKLRYVFDVSDTNSYYGYEVPRWKVKERYHDEIAQALINSFGEVAEGELESVKTRLNKSALIRYLILGYKPTEAPPIEYKVLIRELRATGNNINQLIVIARSNGILNVSELKRHLDELDNIEDEMHKAFDFRKQEWR